MHWTSFINTIQALERPESADTEIEEVMQEAFSKIRATAAEARFKAEQINADEEMSLMCSGLTMDEEGLAHTNYVRAIKMVRDRTKLGLKECRDMVRNFRDGGPHCDRCGQVLKVKATIDGPETLAIRCTNCGDYVVVKKGGE